MNVRRCMLQFLYRWRAFTISALAMTVLLAGAPSTPVFADVIYGVSDEDDSGITSGGLTERIFKIDTVAGTVTPISNPFPNPGGGLVFALGGCSDGLLYLTGRLSPLFTYNPATPAVNPAKVSAGAPDLDGLIGMACHPTTGDLYAINGVANNLLKINRTSGVATIITLTLPGTTPPVSGATSGDLAFDAAGTLFFLGQDSASDSDLRLWTIDLVTNTLSNVSDITTAPVERQMGLANNESGGNLIMSIINSTRFYTVSKTGGATTALPMGGPASTLIKMHDLANLVPTLPPSITLVKSSTAFSDPMNGTTTPKRIPGGVLTYSIVTTNSGQGSVDSNTTVLTDPIPTNTDMVVSDFGGAGSGPIAFINGSPSSGLTYTFTSLASTTDDVTFFTDAGCTTPAAGVTPVADANGVDLTIRCIRVNPKGIFAADDAVPPSPNFTISFRARIR